MAPLGRMGKWLDRAVMVLSAGYVAGLLLIAVLFRVVGERWWVTAICLFLPRVGFAAPLPFIAALVFWRRLKAWRWVVLLATVLVVFPVMGFSIPTPHLSPDGTRLRIFSFNVNAGYGGWDKIAREVQAYDPDVVLLQEAIRSPEELVDTLKAAYPSVQIDGQLVVLAKMPITSSREPDKIAYYGRSRSPRYKQYVLQTKAGPVGLYNVHPISPRGGFYAIRGQGLTKEIRSGRLFAATNVAELMENSGLRGLQVKAFAGEADRETTPVIIAGDMNVPAGSMLLYRELGRYQDGFVKAGFGFGNTFPERNGKKLLTALWMRIDRVMASPEFTFTDFEVGCAGLSDHRCVIADLVLSPR